MAGTYATRQQEAAAIKKRPGRMRKLAASAALPAAAASTIPVPAAPEASAPKAAQAQASKEDATAGTSTSSKNAAAAAYSKGRGQRSVHHPQGNLLKNMLLLAAIAGIGFMLLNAGKGPPQQLPEMPRIGKTSQLEEALATTRTWLQAQLDMVDDKIKNEFGLVRSEMEQALSVQTTRVMSQVSDIQAQVRAVDGSLQALQSKNLLSREETAELVASAIAQRAEAGGALSLDDVRMAARKQVQDELQLHAADGIGRADYALRSGGGKVIRHSEGYFQGLPWRVQDIITGTSHRRHPMADKVLQPSFGEPGQCLPLKGSNVFVDIRLRCHIVPEAISLEHVSKLVAYDISSAAKEFRVFGWDEDEVTSEGIDWDEMKLLGEFTYDLDGRTVQTFKLESSQPVNAIRLHVLSNHGSPTHTCLYRLRVHGVERS